MCDTLVALGNSTQDKSVVFGKNSDRPPNEAQVLRRFPRMKYPKGSVVKCTYVEVPQASGTFEVLLSCPFWMWGAEIGANERGVAIGNEAVWSKEGYADTGLLGMDLLRLGLERGATAKEALEVIIELLKEHGQGGDCFFGAPMKYHNSFIIADPDEAWVLETADKYWVAERVKDVRSISNGYTIGKHWDVASPGLVKHAIENGWCQSEQDFDFAQCYGDAGMRELVHCVERANRSTSLMKDNRGKITVSSMMDYLGDHEGYDRSEWNPDKQLNTVCMHAGPEVISQSTASYVGHLSKKVSTHWFTGGSSPCMSVYVPFYSGSEIPGSFSKGGDKFRADSYWWGHEKLVRSVQHDYPSRAGFLASEVKDLQSGFLKEAEEVKNKVAGLSAEVRSRLLQSFTSKCAEIVTSKNSEWLKAVEKMEPTLQTKSNYLDFLKSSNESAEIMF
jgi:dipeptidase